ncbi:MAG: extracellular solute-binding protein [Clostridiales bacterium]|jgi:ABC-type glycerol-3-phosphate transport system substrate-binding protein|nr:extracellular solute-binding protein [Clostridiales bacterium]
MKIKIICALMCLLILSAAVSCGSKDTTDPAVTGGSSETTAETTPEETLPSRVDSLPDISLNGESYVMLLREERAFEFYAEDTGDIIDTAVYNRDRSIEERFECEINYVLKPGLWGSAAEFKSVIRGAVMSGDGAFDIVTGQSNIVQPLNVEKLFVNLLDMEYIDLTKSYWLESYTEGINLNGEVNTVAGEFAHSCFSNANVIYFNKAIMDDNGMTYPYEDALNGAWTLDKFITLAESATKDLNGDGVLDGTDIHGYCSYGNYLQPFFSSCGLEYTEIGDDGRRVLRTPDDRMIDVAERLNAFCRSEHYINSDKTYGGQDSNLMEQFMNGKFLFMGMMLEGTETLREMEVDYGLLPYPKYNEEQERYYDTILRRYTVAAVPTTAKNPDNSALILEALASEGYSNILPKYYEIALKDKYIRDEASSKVLDLIRSSLWLEFVDLYYNDLAFSDYFAGYVESSSGDTFASSYEKNRKTWESKIENLYKSFEG